MEWPTWVVGARSGDSLVRDREWVPGIGSQAFEAMKQGGNHEKRPAPIRKIDAGQFVYPAVRADGREFVELREPNLAQTGSETFV